MAIFSSYLFIQAYYFVIFVIVSANVILGSLQMDKKIPHDKEKGELKKNI